MVFEFLALGVGFLVLSLKFLVVLLHICRKTGISTVRRPVGRVGGQGGM